MGEGKTQLVVTANPEPAGQGVAVDGSNESLTGIECVCRWNRHLTLSFGEYHLEGWNLEVPNRHTGLRRRRRYTTGLRLIGFVIFMSTRKRKQRKKKFRAFTQITAHRWLQVSFDRSFSNFANTAASHLVSSRRQPISYNWMGSGSLVRKDYRRNNNENSEWVVPSFSYIGQTF